MEVDAEDLVRANDYYHARPYFRSADKPVDHYNRFCSPPAEDFYKKPVLCAAHVVGSAEQVKYRNRLEAVQAIQRQQEDWNVRLKSDGPSYPEMVRKSYNSQELHNQELKFQRQKEQVGEPRGLKNKVIDQIRAIQADRRNAEDTLAYERAKFHADCAARNIRTTEDAERAWIRIAVARAEVVGP